MIKVRMFRSCSTNTKNWWKLNRYKKGQFIKVFNDLNELVNYCLNSKTVFLVNPMEDLSKDQRAIFIKKYIALYRKRTERKRG